ncbi:apolipoprotein N-acyltransferase [Hymenobacter daecheongensis DSM 21074]|uniref:Apolipoprotein N-acyltransferase n=1 Tax=Hymenobacter daecheongensis DSM 21074 TaxID=1121955 RepID=A0A1M6B0B2_9BACT|nr:apolipoprotein N-acyltransferase [Hymenobacter daecheongensis]SHI42131.1 apolipoprotein N-acyltransferase [Hymenobacter daecheongensis DSM 21074]
MLSTAPAFTWTRPASWPPALLALLSAGLLWLGWPVHPAPLALVLLVGWVPYLYLEAALVRRGATGWKVFRYTYLTLVLWNAFTTWWVSYSTLGGGIAAVVLNALLMCLPTMAFYHTKRLAGPRLGYVSLPIYWIAFEQLHLHWDFTWPWLTLGNGFATATEWVQWYEYTGFLGGSVWIWVVNLLVFFSIENDELRIKNEAQESAEQASTMRRKPFLIFNSQFLIATLVAILLPIVVSKIISSRYQEKGQAAEVLVIQPNFDPFQEKFEGGAKFIPYHEQLQRMFRLTEQNLTPQTKLVLWPETSLEENNWEATFEANPKALQIRSFLARHPGLELITGATTLTTYPSKETASESSRYRDDIGYYDFFNTAVFFGNAAQPVQFYHKSRLVPGVEGVPHWLSAFVIDLGGAAGGLGRQAQAGVFRTTAPDSTLRTAPVICYESVYGDYVSQYIRRGATLIGIITNDGWWSDSPGHLQHLHYATLRAIETRRAIARSANTGISAFINQKGEIIQQTGWWVPAALRGTVRLNTEMTFYVRYGELIGRGAQVLAVLLLAFVMVRALNRRFAV